MSALVALARECAELGQWLRHMPLGTPACVSVAVHGRLAVACQLLSQLQRVVHSQRPALAEGASDGITMEMAPAAGPRRPAYDSVNGTGRDPIYGLRDEFRDAGCSLDASDWVPTGGLRYSEGAHPVVFGETCSRGRL